MRGEVLRAAVGLDLHDPPADASLGRNVGEPAAEQLERETSRRPVEPGRLGSGHTIGRRSGHQTRRSAISSGTKGRITKPATGMMVSRKKPMMSELFSSW